MSRRLTTDTDLTAIANAIRTKGETSAPLVYPSGFINAINAIEVGIDTSDANATANDILNGKTAYVNGSKVTGNIPSQGAQTITPGTTNQTITAGKYLTGAQTIAGDSNLVAANIAEGVSIFGVTGTHSGSSSLPSFNPSKVIEFSVYGEDRGETFVLYTINGMTWNEYINSNFKGHDLFIVYPDTNTIYSNALTYQGTDPVHYGNETVSPNDVIQENGSYVIVDDENEGGSGH